jgi:hypothetical protein
MTDKPPDAHPAPQQGTDPTPSGTTSTKPGLLERVWTLPGVVAVALASVIIGGLGGAALASASDDGSDGHDARFGPGHNRVQGPGHNRVQKDGHLRRPGMMNERQRKLWREWRQEQRRQGRPDGLPSPSRPTKPTPTR